MTRQEVVCVTGIDGALGQAIAKRLENSGYVVNGVPSEYLNLATDALVRQLKKLGKARYIVNAAELSDLNIAEQHPDLAYQANVVSCEAIIELALEWGATVIHLSSFQIFDGQKKNAYISANKGHPLNAYGRTKMQAEELLQTRLEKLLIIRLGWLLDPGIDGWVANTLKDWLDNKKVRCYPDVELAPTASEDIARVIDAVLKQLGCGINVWGIYHYASAESVTHEELMQALQYQSYGQDAPEGQIVSTPQPAEFDAEDNLASQQSEVKLPKNGVLGCIKLRNTFGIKQLPWRRYLPAMVEHLAEMGLVKTITPGVEKEAAHTINR